MEHKKIGNIEEVLTQVKEDNTVPKNVRLKIEGLLKVLNENIEMQIKISKVLNELEEIVDDVNLESYTRTQIWSVISELEKNKLD